MPNILKALFQGDYRDSALRDTSFNLAYADCHEDIFNILYSGVCHSPGHK